MNHADNNEQGDSVQDAQRQDATELDERTHYPAKREEVVEFRAGHGVEPTRLDVYLSTQIKNATRSKVQIAVEADRVSVNGKIVKSSYKVQPGDLIVCRILKRPPIELLPENIPLDIVYEDDDVLVVNKPAGMVVHPAHGNRYGTLVNAVLYHMGQRESIVLEDEDEQDEAELDHGELLDSNALRPGIVHRIDKDTSGILVVGKNPMATEDLSAQFAKRTAKRVYHALVWGLVKNDEETIDLAIARSPKDRKVFCVNEKEGKSAITDYKVLARYDFLTKLELRLRTGRTHQIRVHCANMHHPLLGDSAYGGDALVYGGIRAQHTTTARRCLELMPRQALHASSLGFKHPRSGEWMDFHSELPADFQAVIELVSKLHAQSLEN